MAGTVQRGWCNVGQNLLQSLRYTLDARGHERIGVGDVSEDGGGGVLIGPILSGELSKGLARDPAGREIIGSVQRRVRNRMVQRQYGNARRLRLTADFGVGFRVGII